MQKKFNLSETSLGPYNKIIFGPFLGSLEFEVLFWRGFVQKYIKDHPEKNIVISTRYSRKDLYSGFGSIMDLFELETENGMNQDGYSLQGLSYNDYDFLKNSLIKEYPGYYIVDPMYFGSDRTILNFSNLDHGINISESAKIVLNRILINHHDPENKIVIVDPVKTQDNKWIDVNWTELIRLILNKKKYTVLVLGLSDYYRPILKNKSNLIFLNDYVSSDLGTTVYGMCIAALDISSIRIAAQPSKLLLMSNYCNKEVVSWGKYVNKYIDDLFLKCNIDVKNKLIEGPNPREIDVVKMFD